MASWLDYQIRNRTGLALTFCANLGRTPDGVAITHWLGKK